MRFSSSSEIGLARMENEMQLLVSALSLHCFCLMMIAFSAAAFLRLSRYFLPQCTVDQRMKRSRLVAAAAAETVNSVSSQQSSCFQLKKE